MIFPQFLSEQGWHQDPSPRLLLHTAQYHLPLGSHAASDGNSPSTAHRRPDREQSVCRLGQLPSLSSATVPSDTG